MEETRFKGAKEGETFTVHPLSPHHPESPLICNDKGTGQPQHRKRWALREELDHL